MPMTSPTKRTAPKKPASPARPKGQVTETRLKFQLLILMLAVKLVVMGFLFTLWESGGFTNDQFISTVGLLVPVFTTYLGAMVREVVQQSKETAPQTPDLFRPRSFQLFSFAMLGLYFFGLLVIIGLAPQGRVSFAQMSALLALLESGFGIYIGQIVFSLLKKTPSEP